MKGKDNLVENTAKGSFRKARKNFANNKEEKERETGRKEPKFTAKEKKKIFLVNQEVNRSLGKLNKRHQKDVQSAEWLKKELLDKYASVKDNALKVCIEVSIAGLKMQTNARYQEIYSVTRILGGEKKAAVI